VNYIQSSHDVHVLILWVVCCTPGLGEGYTECKVAGKAEYSTKYMAAGKTKCKTAGNV